MEGYESVQIKNKIFIVYNLDGKYSYKHYRTYTD